MRDLKDVFRQYRRFVPDFVTLVQPGAFEAVKSRLVADPILACPDFTKAFVFKTDASDYGLSRSSHSSPIRTGW